MHTRLRAILLILGLLVASGAARVDAVPSLQLYSPGSTYTSDEESWLTTEEPFDLWVLGAKTPAPIHYTSHLTLFIAVPNQYWDENWLADGDDDIRIRITAATEKPTGDNASFENVPSSPPDGAEIPLNQPFSEVILTENGVTDSRTTGGMAAKHHGHPDDTGLYDNNKFPDHGVYSNEPVHFWSVPLPLLQVSDAGETVYDYNGNFTDVDEDGVPDDPSELGMDTGDIHFLHVQYKPFNPDFLLHFDVVGLAHNSQTYWRNNPFSHDADAQALPEPATVALLGAGLIGLAVRRRYG